MEIFFLILKNIIFPIFLLIGLGAILHRIFKFDLNTLSKLNTFFLLPAVCFVNIYQGEISGQLITQIIFFCIVLNVLLIVVSYLIAKINGFDPGLSASFRNSMVLSNSGNFGLPVSELVFHTNPLGMSIQVIISIFQNLLTYTYGLFNAVSANAKGSKLIKEIVRLPVLYALLLAVLFRSLDIAVPGPVWKAVQNTANAFLAIALVTLGAQVAYLKIKRVSRSLLFAILGRLVLSPIVALFVIMVLGWEGTIAQALFIASSFPTSRNSALIALEYNNHPEFATQVVLLTTILSSLSVAVVVYASSLLF
ncbi:AEC family transporter [Ammoniphilus sp. CFH 90114]|uniref:AEC family transporter n=1 Tax=Ammoniphilus sp. CFH 90114 TaxID=2493665 RepID=UPI00100FD7FE|nr:AEC family transporter [Ammoniphilus sp. CFH 90114]RXT13723.1 AEC family transporter [Ammoniphilus sp. CFH 90114]